MCIEKDCCLILLLILLYFIFRFIALKRKISMQNDYFIKTLWHDIRIPVIAQINSLAFIKNNNMQNTINSKLLKEIEYSCNYTLDMITMLMHIFKIEKNDFNVRYEKIYPQTIIADILSAYSDLISEKNISIRVNIKTEILFIDSENFINLVKVLLFIAIQYSEKNGKLDFCIDNDLNNILNIEVNYIGMPISENIHKYTFRKNIKYSAVGHDIHMYLCKKIISLYKGKCEFITNNYKNTFSIKMPNVCYKTNSFGNVDNLINCISV